MVEIPSFPECKHPIVSALARHTDHELLTLFQRRPESGQYFLAIFCRYSSLVFTLIQHSARSPVQANYLFAMTWRHIYHELRGVELRDFLPPPSLSSESDAGGELGQSPPSLDLQSWLINITAVCINKAQLPPTEAIHYAMEKASPPLWCYLEQAMNQLGPKHRLVLLLAQTFHWSRPRILAYLQAEGEPINMGQLNRVLEESYIQLHDLLPEDIQDIYLTDLLEQKEVSMSSNG